MIDLDGGKVFVHHIPAFLAFDPVDLVGGDGAPYFDVLPVKLEKFNHVVQVTALHQVLTFFFYSFITKGEGEFFKFFTIKFHIRSNDIVQRNGKMGNFARF